MWLSSAPARTLCAHRALTTGAQVLGCGLIHNSWATGTVIRLASQSSFCFECIRQAHACMTEDPANEVQCQSQRCLTIAGREEGEGKARASVTWRSADVCVATRVAVTAAAGACSRTATYARASKGTGRFPERDRGSEHEHREKRSKGLHCPSQGQGREMRGLIRCRSPNAQEFKHVCRHIAAPRAKVSATPPALRLTERGQASKIFWRVICGAVTGRCRQGLRASGSLLLTCRFASSPHGIVLLFPKPIRKPRRRQRCAKQAARSYHISHLYHRTGMHRRRRTHAASSPTSGPRTSSMQSHQGHGIPRERISAGPIDIASHVSSGSPGSCARPFPHHPPAASCSSSYGNTAGTLVLRLLGRTHFVLAVLRYLPVRLLPVSNLSAITAHHPA